MSDFLFEIGLEEIPARMIASAEAELGRRVTDLLQRERLLEPEARIATYSTPRRLAVLARGVLPRQTDIEEELTGPSWKVAFKDGAPTAAAQAFARKVRGRDGDPRRPICGRDPRFGAPDGVFWLVLGKEHVLARGQAGAVGTSGAVDGGGHG
jgi:hypothetical protein